ncbi:hypothetical protein ACJQWK_10728 [Exserohilum turcicum]
MEPDASFPADLKKLGFFVNTTGHIRMINAPEKPFLYHATNNERVNEVRREAMQACQRMEVEVRLASLGLKRIYLPAFTLEKPNGPHVPILAPVPETLKKRKRVIVLVNSTLQDLGILSYGELQRDLGINGGSVVNFVKEMVKRSRDDADEQNADIFEDGYRLADDSLTPGLVVMNTAQFLYSHKHNQAMTLRSWSAMLRKSIAHDMIRIHTTENHVQGHRTAQEHVKTVFDQVICNPDRVAADADVYLIAIEDGNEHVLNLLAEDFEKYGTRITAMALINSLMEDSQIKDPRLRAFLHQRARQWKFSDVTPNPLHCTDLPEGYEQDFNDDYHLDMSKHIAWHEEVPNGPIAAIQKTLRHVSLASTAPKQAQPAPSSSGAGEATVEWSSGQRVVCPTFGGGPSPSGESILTHRPVQHAVLSFFEQVSQDPENYRNKNLIVYKEAPKPSPDNPLALFAEDAENNTSSVSDDKTTATTIEQAELSEGKEELMRLRQALNACPDDMPELESGREKLARKIAKLECQLQAMEEKEKKALEAAAAVQAAAQQTEPQVWRPEVQGAKVPFAGTTVDSELLRAAGLMESS